MIKRLESCPPNVDIPLNKTFIKNKRILYKCTQSTVFLFFYCTPGSDGINIVMKCYKKKHFNSSFQDQFINEIEIAELGSSCPYILRYFGYWEADNKVYVLSEYARYGDMFDFIFTHKMNKSIPLCDMLSNYFLPISLAVKHLHEMDAAHLDIKPENVFLHDDGVRLSDFGFSKKIDDLHIASGTNRSISPVYQLPCRIRLNNDGNSMKRIDVWCLGRLLYELLLGTAEYDTSNIHLIKSKTIRNLLKRMLDVDDTVNITDVVYLIREYVPTADA